MGWIKRRLWVPIDGRVAVVRDDEALTCVAPDGARRWAVPSGPLYDVAMVGDELWTCEEGGVFRRRAVADGLVLAENRDARADGPGFLATSAFAPGVAIWNGAARLHLTMLASDLAVRELPGVADIALPVVDDAVLYLRRGVVELRAVGADAPAWIRRLSDDPVDLAHAGVLFGGTSLALLLGRPDETFQLVTLSAIDGTPVAQIGLRGVHDVAYAVHRGHVVLQVRRDRVSQIDIREGEILRDVSIPGGIDGVAVDGAAAKIVVLRGGRVTWRVPHELDAEVGGAEIGGPAAAPAARGNGSAAAAPRAAAPTASPAPAADDAPAAPPPPDELPRGPFFALAVAPELLATSPSESAAVLEVHLRLIGARALLSIAKAWDSGRLTVPTADQPPFATEVQGLLGLGAGRAPAQVAQAEALVKQAEDELRAVTRSCGERRWPLAIMRREFGLSPLAAEILAIAAAPALRGELARVYAILCNDTGRPLCDELLVCQVLGEGAPRDRIASELDRDQPLRKHGLLLEPTGAERPFSALRVDPLVLRRLRGQPLDHDLEGLEPYTATRRLGELRFPVAALAGARQALEAPHDPAHPLRLIVRGRIGTGRRSLVAALAATVGRRLALIDAATFSGPGRLEGLRATMRRAAMRGLVPMIDGLDEIAEDDRASQRALRDLFGAHPGPLAFRLGWDTSPILGPGYVQIDLPTATEGDRMAVLGDALGRHGMAARGAAELAARFRVGPGIIERVIAGIARTRHATQTAMAGDATAELTFALQQHITNRLGATATRVKRLAGWSDIVLPEDVLDSLREFVSRVRHRRTVYERWGYDKKLTSARGVTALFSGSPGTGKTLVASAIAKDLGLDLYRVDLARVVSKWIGETERNLASVFDAAEDGQAIVLFDEADSLFTKRTEVKSSVDRYANLEVNYLLQRLDTFEGIAILTTNFGSGIDAAFKRRLSFRLTFPFPDEEMRERLWRIHVPPEVPKGGDLDFIDLAEKYRLSGGYIRNAAVRAAFIAASEGASLTQDHLERAVHLEYREIGKLAETGTLE